MADTTAHHLERLRQTAAKYRESTATQERDSDALYAEIRESAAAGLSYRQIAAEVKLSYVRVGQIVNGKTAR